jgi:DnaJ-class molecular chaperone
MRTTTKLSESQELQTNNKSEELAENFRKKKIQILNFRVKFFPDKMMNNEELKMEWRKLTAACSILSDEKKRKIYNQLL